jgi:6-pyruvoyl-tetrahydropterin synthase
MKSKFDKLALNVIDENDHHYMTKIRLFNQGIFRVLTNKVQFLEVNCLFIWPADEKYIKHYGVKSVKCLETAESYRKYTKKYIKKTPSCKWIINVLGWPIILGGLNLIIKMMISKKVKKSL